MKQKKELVDVVFILDRSGSMQGTEKDTIGGYNGYIKDFENKNAKITTILFDDKYEFIIEYIYRHNITLNHISNWNYLCNIYLQSHK